ncbi:tyrosine-type recombinase/integrase [Roseiconus lacunae]|uniref:tyrosine-type recombinase/integrase n=1 Tax=Roseiconus lacunae TaxID=2605694 RepID=UPI0011F3F8B1|nr:tyrosine-type recombinase/integrase [Roseiconus lacunae]
MATKYRLSYRKKEKRWRKFYRGKYYHFPLRDGETKEGSYQRVLNEWLSRKAVIDSAESADNSQAVERSWRTFLDDVRSLQQRIINSYGDTEETREIWLAIEKQFVDGLIKVETARGAHANADQRKFLKGMLESTVQSLQEAHWQPTREFHENAGVATVEATGAPPWEGWASGLDDLRQLAKGFVANVRADSSIRRAENVRRDVDRFLSTLPGNADAESAFASTMLDGYLQAIKGLDLSASTKRDRIASVKQFATWLFEREHLSTLPRLIQAGKFKVEVKTKAIEVYEDSEVKEIVKAASGPAKLYILLSLNCGFTQIDIADLKRAESDLGPGSGTITRKRSKTANHDNVPEVTYRLWPETLSLLRKYATAEGERLLLNKDGNPLVRERDDGGKVKRTDAVSKAMARLRDKMERKDTISVKVFRKTASTKLASKYPDLVELFLGHAPKTVADRHYAKPSQERFDKALDWLRGQFLDKGDGSKG